jgi:hypothetical protein
LLMFCFVSLMRNSFSFLSLSFLIRVFSPSAQPSCFVFPKTGVDSRANVCFFLLLNKEKFVILYVLMSVVMVFYSFFLSRTTHPVTNFDW